MNKDKLLTELIKELAHDSKLDDNKLKSYELRFCDIYSDNYRHEYSEVTRVLFSIKNDEERDFLPEKIKNIRDSMENNDVKKRVSKLWDHINLENIRLAELRKISIDAHRAAKSSRSQYTKLKKEQVDLKQQWDDIGREVKNVRDDIVVMNKDVDNSTAKSITILGIFSGIVMAFTGGLSFIASSLSNVNDMSKYRLVLVVLLLSAAIFNIIYMLIHTIGKITKTYIGSRCNCDNPLEGCCNKTRWCAMIRHPIFMCFNIVTLLSLFLTSILYVVDKYNLLTLAMYKNLYLTITLIAIGLAITIFLVLFSLGKLLKAGCKGEREGNCD